MKIARKIPLLCCILSMAYVAGCTLEEPNDLGVKCYGKNITFSQIIYTTIDDNRQSMLIRCLRGDTSSEFCSELKLNFDTGYCPKTHGCILNESNTNNTYSCVDIVNSYFDQNETDPICDGNTHAVQIKDEDHAMMDSISGSNRCKPITFSTGNHDPSTIGYCCDNDIYHCGSEDTNCTLDAEWKAGICINGECTPCKNNQHINSEGECEDDSDSACGINLENCELKSTQEIQHASGEHFTCIDGSCTLKCEDNYKANEGNTYCYSDSDVEHCGIDNINCNQLPLQSDYAFLEFECNHGQCIPQCEDGFEAHIPELEDNMDSYYCEANCNGTQCGPNRECIIHEDECIEYSGIRKVCSQSKDGVCSSYNYYSLIYAEQEDTHETSIDGTQYTELEDMITTNPKHKKFYKCLSPTADDECLQYKYCSIFKQELKCDCIEGYEEINDKCIPQCNSDGYIDTYWNGEIKKARCIQTVADLDSMRPENWVNNEEKIFYFMNDIMLGTTNNWVPIGSSESPFNGIVIGNNKMIQGNITCNREDGLCGLFGYVKDSSFHDLYLELNLNNQSETVSSETNNSRTGALVANASQSLFMNIRVNGFIASKNVAAGGIVGDIHKSTLTACFFYGSIESNQPVGGIIGMQFYNNIYNGTTPKLPPISYLLYSSQLSQCHVSASLHGSDVGGLIGSSAAWSNINISYASFSGTLTGKNVGGLIGSTYNASISESSVAHSEINSDLSNNASAGGLVGNGLNISVIRSYVYNSFLSGYIVGGLIGKISYIMNNSSSMSASIKSSYFDGELRAINLAGGLIGYANNLTPFITEKEKIVQIEESAVFGRIYGFINDEDCTVASIGSFVGEITSGFISRSLSVSDLITAETVGYHCCPTTFQNSAS